MINVNMKLIKQNNLTEHKQEKYLYHPKTTASYNPDSWCLTELLKTSNLRIFRTGSILRFRQIRVKRTITKRSTFIEIEIE